MQTRLERTFRFEAAHFLPKVPPGHKCARMHGHSYVIDIAIEGPIDPELGWLIDFAEIDAELGPLIKIVDHRLLNEVQGLENPTAEIIAAWFYDRITDCESVRVYENDECWAEVTMKE